jgi:hypothetical protein
MRSFVFPFRPCPPPPHPRQDRVLILTSDELRFNQTATMDRLLAFTGLRKPNESLQLMTPGFIEER